MDSRLDNYLDQQDLLAGMDGEGPATPKADPLDSMFDFYPKIESAVFPVPAERITSTPLSEAKMREFARLYGHSGFPTPVVTLTREQAQELVAELTQTTTT